MPDIPAALWMFSHLHEYHEPAWPSSVATQEHAQQSNDSGMVQPLSIADSTSVSEEDTTLSESDAKQHVPVSTEGNNMCLPKWRKMCIREIVQNQHDFATERSIKAEDFRPWTMYTSPEWVSHFERTCQVRLGRERSPAPLSLRLCLARSWQPRQPPLRPRSDLDSWDWGLLSSDSLVWCYCWLSVSDYYC